MIKPYSFLQNLKLTEELYRILVKQNRNDKKETNVINGNKTR